MRHVALTPPHGRGSRPTLSTLATATVPVIPAGEGPARMGFFWA
jgi:hypothetical protein